MQDKGIRGQRGSCTRVWEEILGMFDNCYAMKDVKQVKKESR